MLFLIRANESIYGHLFEDIRKTYFLRRDEYTETINGVYKLFVHNSRQFGGIILRGGRLHFRNESGCGGGTSVMFTQT